MNILSELFNDAKFILTFRTAKMASQGELNRKAPRAGALAPNFTLTDSSGSETVTLSDFRGQKPVALVFGSFT